MIGTYRAGYNVPDAQLSQFISFSKGFILYATAFMRKMFIVNKAIANSTGL